MDRIDIHVQVPRVEFEKLASSRTIADLADAQEIAPTRVAEALQYRPRLWA